MEMDRVRSMKIFRHPKAIARIQKRAQRAALKQLDLVVSPDQEKTRNGRQIVGIRLSDGRRWGGYIELTCREDDGKRYLQGGWRTDEKTKVWEGRVALRYEYGK